jgi:hypothetical protein
MGKLSRAFEKADKNAAWDEFSFPPNSCVRLLFNFKGFSHGGQANFAKKSPLLTLQ